MTAYDSKVTQIFVAQYDLSGFTTDLSPATSRKLNQATVFGDDGHMFIPSTHEDSLKWSGLFDDGASGSDVIMGMLRSATAAKVLSAWPGGSAQGDIGYATDQGWGQAPEMQSQVGNLVTYSNELAVSKWARVTSLRGYTTQTGDDNGNSNNDGASSANGGRWFYWVIAITATGGNAQWKLDFSHSANDSTWADKDAVTLTSAGGPTSGMRTVAGTIDQYTRQEVFLDATSGSITVLSAYERD